MLLFKLVALHVSSVCVVCVCVHVMYACETPCMRCMYDMACMDTNIVLCCLLACTLVSLSVCLSFNLFNSFHSIFGMQSN